ncbi:hypothetical protein C8R45DRAFT_963724, partial [Mycena sanguinolenta]
ILSAPLLYVPPLPFSFCHCLLALQGLNFFKFSSLRIQAFKPRFFCHLGYSFSVFGLVYSMYVPPHFPWPTIRATLPALALRVRN